jgi:SAM-dependent methyltransferase
VAEVQGKDGVRPADYARTVIPRRLHRPLRNAVAIVRAPLLHGSARQCPICGGSFRRFLPSPGRQDAICPGCYSAERHRLLWLYLHEETGFFTAPLRVLHIAPENCFESRFRRLPNLDYVTADLDAPADVKLDLTDSSLPSESFDVIFCLHILEHIRDDDAAIAELRRMIRPDGFVVVDVPLDDRDETFEPATDDPDERFRLLGQRDHVRFYGRADLRRRLSDGGFAVSIEELSALPDDRRHLYAVPRGATVHVCRRVAGRELAGERDRVQSAA